MNVRFGMDGWWQSCWTLLQLLAHRLFCPGSPFSLGKVRKLLMLKYSLVPRHCPLMQLKLLWLQAGEDDAEGIRLAWKE